MKNRFYKMPLLLLLAIVLFPIIMACIPIIESPKENWYAIFICIPFIILDIIIIVYGFFNPVVICDSYIKFKRRHIVWGDLCITLLPFEATVKTKNYRNGYFVIFNEKFVSGKEAWKELRQGNWIILSEKSISKIVESYKKPIQVLSELNSNNQMNAEIRSRKAINLIIKNHNAKYLT